MNLIVHAAMLIQPRSMLKLDSVTKIRIATYI